MKAFVRQKSIRQVKLSGSYGKESSAKNFFLKMPKFINMQLIWTILIVFILLYGALFLVKHTLFVSAYRITKIDYDSWSIQQYDDPYLYRDVSLQLRGENYYVLGWNRKSILKTIQTKFPIVQDITIDYTVPNTVHVLLAFFEPDMVIKNQQLKFGVYNNYTFPIASGNTIGQWKSVLYLPLYASWLTTIDWLFYRQSAKQLQEQMDIINAAFPNATLIAYLPGGEKTVVVLPDKRRIFINTMTDISQQIKNFEILKKYYTDFATLKEIDLGSLEKDKVIVRR